MIDAIDRLLIALLGFVEGLGVMSIIYDLKLKTHGFEFANQVGMHGPVLIGIKIVFVIAIFITLAFVIIKGKGGQNNDATTGD